MRSMTSLPARARWLVAALAVLLALAGSAAADQTCPPPLQPRTEVELFFGRNIGELTTVSHDDWARFLDDEVTARFPDGLTVIDTRGQWRDTANGRIIREPGKLVVVIVERFETAAEPLAAVIARYKERFRQQSVLLTSRPVCAAF